MPRSHTKLPARKMGRAKGGPEKAAQVEIRRTKVADLMAEGIGPIEIAATLKIPLTTVKSDQRALLNAVRLKRLDTVAEYLDKQLLDRQHLRRLAMREFFRSCQPAIKTSVKRVKVNGTYTEETTITKTEQCGDPRYLELARSLHEDEMKLLGLAKQSGEVSGLGAHAQANDPMSRGSRMLAAIDARANGVRILAEFVVGDEQLTAAVEAQQFQQAQQAETNTVPATASVIHEHSDQDQLDEDQFEQGSIQPDFGPASLPENEAANLDADDAASEGESLFS